MLLVPDHKTRVPGKCHEYFSARLEELSPGRDLAGGYYSGLTAIWMLVSRRVNGELLFVSQRDKRIN